MNALKYPHYEIIVVNDGSTDRTGEILNKYASITVINTTGMGPSVARNLAIEKSRGEFLAFTDGDCLIDPEWLNELLAPFTDAGVMGVGGDQLCPDDETSFGKDVHNFLNLIAFSSDYLKTNKTVTTVNHNPTCNMMYRKKAFQIIGNFKKDLWPCEDLEFDYRLTEAGYTLIFNPKAIVYHYRPKNFTAFCRMHFKYGRAHAMLVKKYGFFQKIHYIPLTLLLLCCLLIFLFFNSPSVSIITLLCLVILPFSYFLLKTKDLFKTFKYSCMFFLTISFWTVGFIRGYADKSIWDE